MEPKNLLVENIWQKSFVGLNGFTYDKTHNIDKQKDLKHLENELHGLIMGGGIEAQPRGATWLRLYSPPRSVHYC